MVFKNWAALCAVALTLPTNAVAQAVCIEIPRLELVQDAAGTICPRAMELPRGENAGSYIAEQADRRGFSRQERLILLSFCQLFGQGLVAGIRR